MTEPATRAWQVSGRVQGVFFRASTAEKATGLGLHGSATNLANGDVYVEAAGEPEALENLAAWLWQGPPAARVEQVRDLLAPDSVSDGFAIG
jgi:acylphosphatase